MSTELQSNPKTKILATVGPAQRYAKNHAEENLRGKVNPDILRGMMQEGVRGFRLNFSHANPKDPNHTNEKEFAWHIREVAAELGIEHEISLLGDLQGPKHRLGEQSEISFETGDILFMHSRIANGYKDSTGAVHVHFENEDVYSSLKAGKKILMADGNTAVEVLETGKDENGLFAKTKILWGNKLSARKGVNFPGSLNISALTEKDIIDLKAMINIGVDKIALSFVQSAADIKELRNILEDLKKEVGANPDYNPKIVAKLEKPQAIINIDEIAQETDEIMFARGDMGVEIDHRLLPAAKKILHRAALKYNKPFIMATQVAPSMQDNPRPTRSEVCAIDTYVQERVDIIMFSEEIAMCNRSPVAAIREICACILQSELLRDNPDLCFAQLIKEIEPAIEVTNEFNQSAQEHPYKAQLLALWTEEMSNMHVRTTNQPAPDALSAVA